MKTVFHLDTLISRFAGTRATTCVSVPLRELCFPSDAVAEMVAAVRGESDAERRRMLKTRLPQYSVSALFNNRHHHSCLVRHSGFLALDFDYKDAENHGSAFFPRLKHHLALLPWVAYAAQSVGGQGYYAIVPVDVPARGEECFSRHRAVFKTLEALFRHHMGLKLDPACADVTRLRTVSYDPEPYVNENPELFDLILPQEEIDAMNGTTVTPPRRNSRWMRKNASNAGQELFFRYLSEIERRHADITADYGDWLRILAGIAHEFGEGGRSYAHALSRHYAGYSARQTDSMFTSLLRRPSARPATLGTVNYLCKRGL